MKKGTFEEVQKKLVFSVARRGFNWAEVMFAAEVWGAMAPIKRRIAATLVAFAQLESGLSYEAVEEKASEFRYTRRLLAASDLADWLKSYGISHDELRSYLRRSIAFEESQSHAISDKQIEEAYKDLSPKLVWEEVVCSGEAIQFALQLEERAAASAALGRSLQRNNLDENTVRTLEDDFDLFCRNVVSAGDFNNEIEKNQIAWTLVKLVGVSSGQTSVTREAAFCLADGEDATDIAIRAGMEYAKESAFIKDVASPMREMLLAAEIGDLVGPVQRGDTYWVGLITQRIKPSIDNPTIIQLAQEAIASRAIRREVVDRVKREYIWLDI